MPVGVRRQLVQNSSLFAGLAFSNGAWDNLGPSARDIYLELKDVEIGQWMPMFPTGASEVTALGVEAFEPCETTTPCRFAQSD